MRQISTTVMLIRLEKEWSEKIFRAKNEVARKFCELVSQDFLTSEQVNKLISIGLDVSIEYE